jgi:hypothetical protein
MKAILKFNLSVPREEFEFKMATKSQEFLSTIGMIGFKLKELLDKNGTLVEAVEMFNEVAKTAGITNIDSLDDDITD